MEKTDHDLLLELHTNMSTLLDRTRHIPELCSKHTANQANLERRVDTIERALCRSVSGSTFWSVIGLLVGVPALISGIILVISACK